MLRSERPVMGEGSGGGANLAASQTLRFAQGERILELHHLAINIDGAEKRLNDVPERWRTRSAGRDR